MGAKKLIRNPFTPSAGHAPPYLAGRKKEKEEFLKLLEQKQIIKNMVLTGLRGVGKTVLLDTFKPEAIKKGWLWAGTDLSESASLTEDSISLRILTDLSSIISSVCVAQGKQEKIGFQPEQEITPIYLNFQTLKHYYDLTPGLAEDKLKHVLELVWSQLSEKEHCKGIVFAYDEAQNLSDKSDKEKFPLSLLLSVFQSIQRKGIPFLLILTGLPTLFPKLVEARTFAERMFHVVTLGKLTEAASRDAITKPVKDAPDCPVRFTPKAIGEIITASEGYPYFIQFFCYETFDFYMQQQALDVENPIVTIEQISRKLDDDFFAGRWHNLTDRQRALLTIIATMDNCNDEFSVSDIANSPKNENSKPFSNSHINQMLGALGERGLIYKNRYGKYSLAVPLFAKFIRRQE